MGIADNLQNLSEEELQAVANLINKFSKRKQEDATTRKRRKKAKKPISQDTVDLVVEKQKGRKKPRKKIVLDKNDTVETKKRGRGRTKPRNSANQTKKRGQGKRKIAARTESVSLSGENEFLKMRERNAEKKDTKIDKLLWKDREVSERPNEYEEVEVQCKECQLWFDVNPGLVLVDEETRETNYTCDGCVRK